MAESVRDPFEEAADRSSDIFDMLVDCELLGFDSSVRLRWPDGWVGDDPDDINGIIWRPTVTIDGEPVSEVVREALESETTPEVVEQTGEFLDELLAYLWDDTIETYAEEQQLEREIGALAVDSDKSYWNRAWQAAERAEEEDGIKFDADEVLVEARQLAIEDFGAWVAAIENAEHDEKIADAFSDVMVLINLKEHELDYIERVHALLGEEPLPGDFTITNAAVILAQMDVRKLRSDMLAKETPRVREEVDAEAEQKLKAEAAQIKADLEAVGLVFEVDKEPLGGGYVQDWAPTHMIRPTGGLNGYNSTEFIAHRFPGPDGQPDYAMAKRILAFWLAEAESVQYGPKN